MNSASGAASHQALSEPLKIAAHAIHAATRNTTSRTLPTWMCRRCCRATQARRESSRCAYSEAGARSSIHPLLEVHPIGVSEGWVFDRDVHGVVHGVVHLPETDHQHDFHHF